VSVEETAVVTVDAAVVLLAVALVVVDDDPQAASPAPSRTIRPINKNGLVRDR